jgi:hypothetical protein
MNNGADKMESLLRRIRHFVGGSRSLPADKINLCSTSIDNGEKVVPAGAALVEAGIRVEGNASFVRAGSDRRPEVPRGRPARLARPRNGRALQ